MPRLSIDITEDQHRRLKATAALNGQSIKDFVMARTLGTPTDADEMTEDEARQALVDLLNERVASARAGNISKRTIEEIRQDAKRKAGVV